MFQIYAIVRRFAPLRLRRRPLSFGRAFWMSVPMMYLAFPVECLLHPLVASASGKTILVNGEPMHLAALHAEIAVLAGLTMVPMAFVAIVTLLHATAQSEGADTLDREAAVRRQVS